MSGWRLPAVLVLEVSRQKRIQPPPGSGRSQADLLHVFSGPFGVARRLLALLDSQDAVQIDRRQAAAQGEPRQ